MAGTYIIDDQNLSDVSYNGTWIAGGSPTDYNQTVASSTNVGDSFTVSFKGTNIAVFGTFDITSGGVETTYSIDGATPVTMTSQAGSGDTGKQQFWRSNTLAIGNHNMTATMVKVNADSTQPGEGTVWFDYFLVTNPTITSSPGGSPADPSQPASTKSSNGVSHTGAIVGGVIGGLFFLLGIVFLFLFFRRRTQIRGIPVTMPGESSFPTSRRATIIEPFRLTMADTSVSGGTSATMSTDHFLPGNLVSGAPPMASRKSVVTARPGTGHSTQASIGNSIFVPDSSEPLPSSSATDVVTTPNNFDPASERDKRRRHAQAASQSISEQSSSQAQKPGALPVQHIDSGMRALNIVTESLSRVELPPVYSPA